MDVVIILFAIAALIAAWRAYTNADGRRTLWAIAAAAAGAAAVLRIASA